MNNNTKHLEPDEKIEKILSFIKLAEELLSQDSMETVAKLLNRDCAVIYDIGISGEPGAPGCYLPNEKLSSLVNDSNIKIDASGEFIILPHSLKKNF
ncbi:MAG: hypothetical protein ACLRT4_13675 [Thomasclavelia sp.]